MKLRLSALSKTWILDVDGTLVKHNGYKLDGRDSLLPGVKAFFEQLPPTDKVILLTARDKKYIPALKRFLRREGLRYDGLLCGMGHGERILVNDRKPGGLRCAYAVNIGRNSRWRIDWEIDSLL